MSSAGRGVRWKTSRAVRVPSTRESTNPSVGVKVSFCSLRTGWEAGAITRSMSPSTAVTTAGSWMRRAASRIISPGATRDCSSVSRNVSSPSSSNENFTSGISVTLKSTSRTCSLIELSSSPLAMRPMESSTVPSFLRSASTTVRALSRSSWVRRP